MKKTKSANPGALLFLILLLNVSGFLLLAFREEAFDVSSLVMGGILTAILLGAYLVLTRLFRHVDRYLFILVDVLICVGMILQYRINPDIAFAQLKFIAIGMGAMAVLMMLLGDFERWKKPVWLYMAGCAALLLLPLAFGSSTYGAKNWINIGGFSFQPSEFVKVALVFILAVWLSEKQRLRQIIPVLLFAVVLVCELVLARDLGAALIYAGTTLVVYYCATGNLLITGAGLGVAAGGAVLSYHLFSHVRVRVAVWRNPWATYYDQGYQIAQGLMAIASGGLFGMGLNLGVPKVIPAYHTDYIFAVICEEMGIIVGLCIIALYMILIVRGISIALGSSDRFCALLAGGCTAVLALQSFLIIGGVIKMIPLTGVTMPFVSYGGSSMISCLLLVGMLQAVAIRNGNLAEKGGIA